jgi:hypothetical protein
MNVNLILIRIEEATIQFRTKLNNGFIPSEEW